jgi:hypothetical protein
MDFKTFSPQLLVDCIAHELKKTDDAKMASILALKRLKKDPKHYEQFGIFESQDMQKARNTKYIKRIPKPGGGYRYFYTQEEYDKFKKEEKPKEKKSSWMNKFASFFGLKSQKETIQKIEQDYKKAKIGEKYNVTWDGWKDHLAEYFNNKEKWDNFFFGKKEKKEKKAEKKEKKEKKKTEVKVKKEGLKLSVMREIFNLYGKKEDITDFDPSSFEETPETTNPSVDYFAQDDDFFYYNIKNKVYKKLKSEIIPGVVGVDLGDQEPIPMEDFLKEALKKEQQQAEESKKSGTAKSKTSKRAVQKKESLQTSIDSVFDAIDQGVFTAQEFLADPKAYKDEKTLGRAVNNPVTWKAIIAAVRKKYNPTEKELEKQRKEAEKESNIKRGIEFVDDNFDTMPETKNEKEYDSKVAKTINEVTPETRNEAEREIVGIPDPPKEEDIERPTETKFKPEERTFVFPISGTKVELKDYKKMPANKIFLSSEKDILEKERPEYIPEISRDDFSYWKLLIPAYKISEDEYILKTKMGRTTFKDGKPVVISKDEYVIVNRDLYAATQDYYLKKEKAEKKKYYDELDEKHGRKFKRKRVTVISKNKMMRSQGEIIREFIGGKLGFSAGESIWDKYKELREDLEQKTDDMNIQIEEYYNTYAKGKETAYGDKGLNDSLENEYGVKVKRQNGAEITDNEINEIKDCMNDLFSVFGDKSSMAKNFGLKISHSGDVLMHARKAAGLFIPSMKAIGVTGKYGKKGTGFILAHEFGHFMDYYLGSKEDRHYSSDNPAGISGQIASTFRKTMQKAQNSKYQRRTCECFARAMEQYWAIKTNNNEILSQWDSDGNHPSEENFKKEIMPLIDQLLEEKKDMLKAFFKQFDKKTGKYKYLKI